MTRLTPDDLAEMRLLRGEGWGYLRLAKRFGVARVSVRRRLLAPRRRPGTVYSAAISTTFRYPGVRAHETHG